MSDSASLNIEDVEMDSKSRVNPISEFHLLPASQRQDNENDRFVPQRLPNSVQKFENRSFLFSDRVLDATSSAFEVGCAKAENSQIVVNKDESVDPETSDKLYETLIASVLFDAKNPHTIKGGALNDFSTKEEIERYSRVQVPDRNLKTLTFSKTTEKTKCQLFSESADLQSKSCLLTGTNSSESSTPEFPKKQLSLDS